MSLNNLAVLLNRTGRHEEAEPMYRESLRLMRKLRGDEHPDVATGMTNLAGLLVKMEQFSEAESLQLEAMEIRRSAFGMAHRETAKSYRLLAEFYDVRNRPVEAAVFRQLLSELPG